MSKNAMKDGIHHHSSCNPNDVSLAYHCGQCGGSVYCADDVDQLRAKVEELEGKLEHGGKANHQVWERVRELSAANQALEEKVRDCAIRIEGLEAEKEHYRLAVVNQIQKITALEASCEKLEEGINIAMAHLCDLGAPEDIIDEVDAFLPTVQDKEEGWNG